MKKRKELTVSVAGRVGPMIKQELEKEAEDMEISFSECVGMYLAIGLNTNGVKQLKHQLQDASDQIALQQTEIERLRKDSVWMREPYASLLEPVLKCENLLEQFYQKHGKQQISAEELKAAGLDFGAVLAGRKIGKLDFYITGRFSWAFVDETRQFIYIRKRD